jgi:hypothetical protein
MRRDTSPDSAGHMSNDPNPKRYCGAPTRNGGTCRHSTNLSATNGRCLVHDPDRVEEWRSTARRGQQSSVAARAENRRREVAIMEGSTAGPRPPVGNSLEEIGTWLRWVLERGASREIDKGEMIALTNGAKALQSVYEKRDLERKVRTLQKQYDELKRQHTGRAR